MESATSLYRKSNRRRALGTGRYEIDFDQVYERAIKLTVGANGSGVILADTRVLGG